MSSGIRPITVVAGAVACGTLATLGLRVAGYRGASNIVLLVTALVAFSPLLGFGLLRLWEVLRRK
jgi:hypothetical protein